MNAEKLIRTTAKQIGLKAIKQSDHLENINLIRKVAFNFTSKTNIEFADLFQEAALAYYESVKKFNPEKGVKFTTFAYQNMHNHLINICKGYQPMPNKKRRGYGTNSNHEIIYLDDILYTPIFENDEPIEEKIENWPEKLKELVNMILENPEKYLGETPNFKRKGGTKTRIRQELQRKGWYHREINNAFKELKTLVQTL